MAWSERQLAMLAAMGLRVWSPPSALDATENETGIDAGIAEAADAAAVTVAVTAAVATAPAARAQPVAAAARTVRPMALQAAAAGDDPMAHPAVEAPQLNWDALRHAVAGCTACRLCESRRQTVFGVGHTRAHWMIIGEAPGEQEDLQGEPFVGKSGRLLDNMLRAIGLSRHAGDAGPAGEGDDAGDPARQVYICNTLKCRPPGNRNPQPDELARCEGYLIRQIELLQPRIILAMGRFAAQSLLRTSEPIGRLRGRVHRLHDVPLVVTYHPAYLLRNLEDKARAWEDLCLAVETASSTAPSTAPAPAGRPVPA